LTGVLLDQERRALGGLELELRECEAAGERARWGDVLAGLSSVTSAFATSASGGDGSFAFSGVPPGGWALFVRGASDVPRAAYLFRIEADQRARHVPLVLARGLFLRGRVLGPEGAPLPGALLSAAGLDASYHERARGAGDGTFVLGPLPQGRYRLEASGAESLVSATTVLFAGDRVELRLAPGGVLDVRASDELGIPVVVQLVMRGASSRSAAGSELRLARLPPGVYELVARTPDGRIGVVQGLRVEAGLAPVPLEVVVRRGCELRLRLRGTERRAWRARWNGRLIDEGALDPGGEASVLVPAGPVSVWWSSDGDEPALEHADERVLAPSTDPVVIEYSPDAR
jgi:hypothetical protein